MQENVTSCEALRVEESLERLEEQTKSDEQVCVDPYSRKTVSFGDYFAGYTVHTSCAWIHSR